jgi:hypothetical protein
VGAEGMALTLQVYRGEVGQAGGCPRLDIRSEIHSQCPVDGEIADGGCRTVRREPSWDPMAFSLAFLLLCSHPAVSQLVRDRSSEQVGS